MRSIVLLLCSAAAQAQSGTQAILERLDRLERQNRELLEEIRALRSELAANAAGAPVEERLTVQERRVDEHAQAKVEAAQRLPVRLSGTVLLNAFINSRYAGTAENPTTAALLRGARSAGGTMRQTTIGLAFDGGETFAGGKLSGTLSMDFFAGTSSTLNHLLRIRTASAQIDWKRTSLMAGQQKPIFSPRDPTSLAQVGVSPLTGSGNPWLWLPQIRLEQRFSFGEDSGLRAQIGVLQTNEPATPVLPEFASTLERARPALQGRFEFRHGNLELAPGFHLSTTHVAATSVPSNALSLDWFYAPWQKLQFTGLVYGGANLANLGTLRQGFTVLSRGNAIAVRTRGGWAQLALLPTERLSFHLMTGLNDDRNSDLRLGGIGRNQTHAANVMYRLSSNVLLALEGAQVRTSYFPGPVRRNNHYDLAIAYLF